MLPGGLKSHITLMRRLDGLAGLRLNKYNSNIEVPGARTSHSLMPPALRQTRVGPGRVGRGRYHPCQERLIRYIVSPVRKRPDVEIDFARRNAVC